MYIYIDNKEYIYIYIYRHIVQIVVFDNMFFNMFDNICSIIRPAAVPCSKTACGYAPCHEFVSMFA